MGLNIKKVEEVIGEGRASPSHIFWKTVAKSLGLCPTLCDPIDGSPPGSPVPGILQARTLEWVAISFSKAWLGLGFIKGENAVSVGVCKSAEFDYFLLDMGILANTKKWW